MNSPQPISSNHSPALSSPSQGEGRAHPSPTARKVDDVAAKTICGGLGFCVGALAGLRFAIPLALLGAGTAFLLGATSTTIAIVASSMFAFPIAFLGCLGCCDFLSGRVTMPSYCGC